MVRVLHVVGRMHAGGLEALIMTVYRAMDREAYQFDFLVHTDEECAHDAEIERLGGRIYRLPRPTARTAPGYYRRALRFFQAHPYEVVHGHMDSTAALYLRAARKCGATVRIAHGHSISAGRSLKGFLTWCMHLPLGGVVTRRVACSRAAARWLFGEKATRAGQVEVIPNAVDTAAFAFSEEARRSLRAALGVEDAFVYGHVGRLEAPKNHAFMLRVFRAIHAQNKRAVLLLVGEGSLEADIRRQAEAYGLGDAVRFLGLRRDIPALMQAMDLFLLPSLYEGLPVVMVEAQCADLPCVISDRVPAESILTELVTVLPLNSPERWAEAGQKALQSDIRARREGLAAVRRAGFDVADTVSRWMALYAPAQRDPKKEASTNA